MTKRSVMNYTTETAADREIRELESKLRMSRHTIVELGIELAREYEQNAPPAEPESDSGDVISFPGASAPQAESHPDRPLEQLFGDYHHVGSHEEFGAWSRAIVDRIIKIAEHNAIPDRSPFDTLSERAACPLCRDTPVGWGYSPGGYALPEGLDRHLSGWGNMRRCPVMDALHSEARIATEKAVRKGEEAKAAQQEARRRNETTYLVDPHLAPKLLDERGWWGDPRNKEELAAAEQRLGDLGFAIETDGNMIAYKFRQMPYVVLADPRERGRLTFFVYDEQRQADRVPRRRQIGRRSAGFYLLDSWRNDLVGKFRTRLATAIAELTGN